MRTSWTTVAVALLIGSLLAPPASTQADTKVYVLKVFLADFEDVPHPERYSREYFDELMFGLDGPRQTPEGRALSGSVREYYLDVSEGRIEVEGEVMEWVRIPRNITKIPHWKRGMKPFGESWPVIVAETLRGHGIGGDDALDEVRLKDGRMPDMLVFLNTDWGTGGVNRGWARLEEVLGMMNLGDLWDDGWSKFPSPYSSFSATKWRNAPGSAVDGTIDKIPPESELEMFPLSIMMHEMGHQLAGWPDLYGPAYEPWGVFDLMGGPAASTHFPMSVSAFLRARSGWMQYTDMPRATRAGLVLQPLETHKQALRFFQGPGQESIIAENRWCLKYPRDYGDPPTNEGPRLLLYRLDPAGRRSMMYGSDPRRKTTTLIRRREHYGEVWGGEGFTEISAATIPSSRNSLGELWWEFRDLQTRADASVRFDARFAATDLVGAYGAASWTDADGVALQPGRFGGSRGHVCMQSTPDQDGVHAQSLSIRTSPAGAIRGRYELPAEGPHRFYATLSAQGHAVVTVAPSKGEATRIEFLAQDAGHRRALIADIPAGADGVDLLVEALDDATPASLSVHEAFVVSVPEAVIDLVRTPAAWTPGATPQAVSGAILCDGNAYGPTTLTLPMSAGAEWTAEWPVSLPETDAVLRGLIGLAADAPVSSAAKVSLTLVGAEKEWPLMTNLEVKTYPPPDDGSAPSPRNWPAVVEVGLPGEAKGQECRVVMRVSASTDDPFTLVLPSLFACSR